MDNRTAKTNRRQPLILGATLGGQPVIRKGTKYGDLVWPGTKYPKYISGGGFYMNRLAVDLFQQFVKVTPKIPIDDALIGAVMKRIGKEGTVQLNFDFI